MTHFNKFRAKGLYPLKGKIKTHKLYGFDCETQGKFNTLVLGSIYGEYKGKEVYFAFNSTEEFISIIRYNRNIFRNSYFFATNLGFDFDVIFDNKRVKMKNKFRFIYQNGNLCYALTYIPYDMKDKNMYPCIPKGKNRDMFYKIYFIDSLNFIKSGVEGIGKIIGINKIKYIPVLDKSGNWKKPSNKEKLIELIEYNKQDSKITYTVMKYIQKTINDIGGELKITASSTSLDVFLRNFLKYPLYQPSREVILYLYDFYFGGRTECLVRGKVNKDNFGIINIYDVNSTYCYAMLDNLPYPNGKETITKDISLYEINNFEGVANVRLKVSDKNYFPLIPVKRDKLMFPVGEFNAKVDFQTLRKALKEGYKIIKIYDGIIYYEKKKPFAEYMSFLFTKRKEYKENNNPMEIVFKLLANSFYGKLGFRFDNKKQYLTTEEMKIKLKSCDLDTQEKLLFESESNGFHHYVEDIFEISTDKNSKIPKYVNPIFAIYITAKARLLLYDYIKPIERDVIYMDTDSIFTRKEFLTSNELGSLKLEDKCSEIIIISPKCYKKVSILEGEKIRLKGVPKANAIIFNKVIAQEQLQYKRILKWKESVKRKRQPNEVVDSIKTLSLEDNKRIWEEEFNINDKIESEPICLNE